MAQLIVRKLEDKIVRKLKERAARYGVSMEEEHRRILRETLLKQEKTKMSFGEFLVSPPYFDDDFAKLIAKRKRDKPRPVNLE
jgi:Antitoxin FitA-like, ribbon-helix-helix